MSSFPAQWPLPGQRALFGQSIHVVPWDRAIHAAGLAKGLLGPDNAHLWTYIPFGPFDDARLFADAMEAQQEKADWQTMVLVEPEGGHALGMASYMRIRRQHGSAEVGCIMFSEALKRSRAATEAMALMATHLFDDLHYRRYEWKCDDTNAPSKRAALRFGFTPEGVFRQDLIVKGRSRDTAWFSILDREWPAVKAGFEGWLSQDNFDETGQQRRSLAEIRADRMR